MYGKVGKKSFHFTMKTLDKNKIKNNFSVAAISYQSHSPIQQKIAQELFNDLSSFAVDTALEVGYGTGFFTQLYLKKIQIQNLYLNDLYLSAFETAQKNTKIIGDAEKINFPKIDLFLSSSTLQWMEDLPAFFQKIHGSLHPKGRAIFSLFIGESFAEIRDFVEGISYYSMDELLEMMVPYFEIRFYKQRQWTLFFEDSLESFRYFQYIGANNFSPKKNLFALRKEKIHKLTHAIGFFDLIKK